MFPAAFLRHWDRLQARSSHRRSGGHAVKAAVFMGFVERRGLVAGAMVIALVLALIGLLALELNRSYQREIGDAGSVTRSIARTLEQQLLASMNGIDLLVREAAHQYRAYRTGPAAATATEMNAMLARHLERVPGLLSLRLINEKGDYVFDASGKVSPANIADRRYFRVQAERPDAGLFPEGPLFSRVVSRWTLTFSRGVRDADGRFLGIVQSSLETSALGSAFNKASLGTSDVVGLYNGEGALVARYPELSDLIGKSQISDELRRLIAAWSEEATYSGVSGADGRLRLYTLRRVGEYPFYVLVGVSYDKILDEWRRTAWIYGTLAACLLLGAVALAIRIFSRYSATVRQIEEQRRLLVEVFEASGEAIIVTDNEGRIVAANSAFTAITGYSVADVIGRTPELLQSERREDGLSHESWTTKCLRGRWRGPVWNRRRNGEDYPALLSISALPDIGGRTTHYIGVFADVTELETARNRAEAASRSKTAFLATMSHELRTPLNIILGFADLVHGQILGPVGNPEYLDHADDARQAGRHLLSLISDIIDYSRIEAGGVTMPMAPVPVREALEMAAGRMHSALAKADLTLRLEVPETIPDLWANDRAIQQMLTNLLSNAAKFTPAGGAVAVTATETAAGPGEDGGGLHGVAITVRDTGIGIPGDQLERVLLPFEQLDTHLTRRQEGTGLGLAIVNGLVKLHKGSLALSSEVGVGTSITLVIPAA